MTICAVCPARYVMSLHGASVGQTMTTREKALEEHIHHLLDEHVAAHLTTNYIDHTQLQVYQVGLATMRTKKV